LEATLAQVEAQLLDWLKEHGTKEVAGYVYPPWLDAAAKLDEAETAIIVAKIKSTMLAWLTTHGEFVDIALWWLECRGQRDRGAWTFVWLLIWDSGRSRDRLKSLGRAWLNEYEGSQHKYWQDVLSRLAAAET
jgi:hypothetical protein